MDGLYELGVDTPIGKITGNLYLQVVEKSVNGYIEVKGKRSFFQNGKVISDNKFAMSGILKAMFKTIKYDVDGELAGEKIILHTRTNIGNFDIQGKKIK